MKNQFYTIKRIDAKQNKANIKGFLKELAAFTCALFVAFLLSVLAWT